MAEARCLLLAFPWCSSKQNKIDITCFTDLCIKCFFFHYKTERDPSKITTSFPGSSLISRHLENEKILGTRLQR